MCVPGEVKDTDAATCSWSAACCLCAVPCGGPTSADKRLVKVHIFPPKLRHVTTGSIISTDGDSAGTASGGAVCFNSDKINHFETDYKEYIKRQ